jgi:D-glycero-alpha-D-manno-heptose 1-phosphate guanylyltransferase
VETIILAGGLGTRLRTVVSDLPKPMALINNKPFLYYIFQWLVKNPVDKVILSTGYMAESISAYFGDSWENIPIEYVIEEKPLGTGGAILNAFGKTSGENILIMNGDTYFPIDLSKFYNLHFSNESLLSIALKQMWDFDRYGSVECSGNSVSKFNEKKPCTDGLINGGIYLLNRNLIESRQFPEVFSFEKEVLEKEAGNDTIKGFVFNDQFIDIGVPEDYSRAKFVLPFNEK